jgi:hypothetical protein
MVPQVGCDIAYYTADFQERLSNLWYHVQTLNCVETVQFIVAQVDCDIAY